MNKKILTAALLGGLAFARQLLRRSSMTAGT